jgi:glycyl-radical enzyme activating protein family
MNGIVFDIKRFAVHDGPGIRTTVFFKGCPLSCRWCHNPESMSADICSYPKTVRIGDKTFTEEETIGREISSADLMSEIRKEKVFMEESDGGVTFSGGEPLQQHEFLLEMLQACQTDGIHTAVDTSGFSSWTILEKIAQYTDLFLYDLKLMDEEEHKEFTGVSNQLILSNLQKLLERGAQVRIRIPFVEGTTFTEKNINATLDFLSSLTVKPLAVDLLPYHNTAAHKYERMNMVNAFPEMKSMNKKDLAEVKERFESVGFSVKIGG